jgi:hypothetical protein
MRLPRSVLPALAVLGCSADAGAPPALPEPQRVSVPAGPGAALPFAASTTPAGSDGTVLVSWVEPVAGGHALRYASWDGGWSQPSTIAEGADWFVNWADFPSIIALPDGRLAAHWLQRSGPGRYSYDVLLTWSADGGTSWAPAIRPHRDGTHTEHGFVALFPHGADLGVVWLDGRQFTGPGHEAGHDGHGDATNEMMVRFTTLAPDGTLGEDVALDDRACDCCQTAVAHSAAGPVVFYRDRSPGEIRDIAVTRMDGGRWTAPRPVHDDGWHITGCPVNGPAADAAGGRIAVAWFTGAGEEPRVNVAFSGDEGVSFTAPVRIDEGEPLGRVDLLLLTPRRALVVWLEHAGDGAELRGRLVDADGRAGPSRTIAATSAQRASGFPRMARRGSDVLLLWTEPGDPSGITAAVLHLEDAIRQR